MTYILETQIKIKFIQSYCVIYSPSLRKRMWDDSLLTPVGDISFLQKTDKSLEILVSPGIVKV